MMYFDRTKTEREIIRLAYQFEIKAIETFDSRPNPYRAFIMRMVDGMEIWENIEEAVEMAYN